MELVGSTGLVARRLPLLRRRRRGFLFTMPMMLGIGIVLFASMIAISQLFVSIGGPMIPDLLADMPTIFHYTEDGRRVPGHVPLFSGHSDAGARGEFADAFPALAMYGLMVRIAIGIFVILLMLAGVSYFFEEFSIVRPGTASAMVAKMAVLIPIYLVLPYMWDAVAMVIESSSLYLMDPFGGDPHARTAEMWCQMGSATCSVDGTTTVDPIDLLGTDGFDRDAVLAQESWSNSLQDPLFGEGLLINVLLSLFKGFAVMFMTAMMFVLSAIRILLIEVIVIAFPLITAVGLIPWINTERISGMLQQNLIGLSVAPIMSAVSLSIGLSTIDSQNMPPLRMWFQLLSVGFLAIFFPVMLSPMLGNLSTRVGTMVSTSMNSATMAGSGAMRGAVQGLSRASETARGMGPAAAPVLHGAGGRQGDGNARFSSMDVGASTSGESPGGMSATDRLRMYGKASAIGMLSGLGAGMLQASSRGIGIGGAFSDVSGRMMHAGDSRIAAMADRPSIGDAGGTAAQKTIAVEDSDPLAAAPLPARITRHTMMNPGGRLDAMFRKNGPSGAGKTSDDPKSSGDG